MTFWKREWNHYYTVETRLKQRRTILSKKQDREETKKRPRSNIIEETNRTRRKAFLFFFNIFTWLLSVWKWLQVFIYYYKRKMFEFTGHQSWSILNYISPEQEKAKTNSASSCCRFFFFIGRHCITITGNSHGKRTLRLGSPCGKNMRITITVPIYPWQHKIRPMQKQDKLKL